MSFWRRLLSRRAAPAAATPARRKAYAAESGYLYDYVYTETRPARGGTEYVFDVRPGRGEPRAIAIFLPDQVLTGWEAAHRPLTASERYGIVKIALKRAMDEAPAPGQLEGASLTGGQLESIAQYLDL